VDKQTRVGRIIAPCHQPNTLKSIEMRSIEMKDALITKAQLARALGCAPSSITSLIARGLPVSEDGRLDRRAALAWIAKSTSGSAGGWSEQTRGRQDIRERAKRLLEGGPKAPPKTATRPAPTQDAPTVNAIVRNAVFEIAAPSEALKFAQVARSVGCSAEQASALGALHTAAATLAVDDLDGDDLEGLAEPSVAEWERALGCVDIAAADELFDRAINLLVFEANGGNEQ
jgi:hypothetical protein